MADIIGYKLIVGNSPRELNKKVNAFICEPAWTLHGDTIICREGEETFYYQAVVESVK